MGNLIRDYYDCLKNGGLPPVSGEQGREVVEILDLICRQGQGHQGAEDYGRQFQEAFSIRG
jgi:hypothetical protein